MLPQLLVLIIALALIIISLNVSDKKNLTMNATPANVSSPASSDRPPPSALNTISHADTEAVVKSFVIYCMAICVVMFCYSLGYALYLWCVGEH